MNNKYYLWLEDSYGWFSGVIKTNGNPVTWAVDSLKNRIATIDGLEDQFDLPSSVGSKRLSDIWARDYTYPITRVNGLHNISTNVTVWAIGKTEYEEIVELISLDKSVKRYIELGGRFPQK